MKPSITVCSKNKTKQNSIAKGFVLINNPGIPQVEAEDQEFMVSLGYIVVHRLASIM